MSENQGLEIYFDENRAGEKDKVLIHGTLSIFVNCGSQYAIWSQFPRNVRYVIKDLDTEEVFESIDEELSISWSGNDVYDNYAKEPCNKVVKKSFSIPLDTLYFINPPEKLKNVELYAHCLGHRSASIFINTELRLNTF